MIRFGVEVGIVCVHFVLESVRIQVDEVFILKPNEIQRMFGFSSNDANTAFQCEKILNTAVVDGIEDFTAKSDRNKDDD